MTCAATAALAHAMQLGCPTGHMCKSMLLENKAWRADADNGGGGVAAAVGDGGDGAAALAAACADPTNSRFYLVVVQVQR